MALNGKGSWFCFHLLKYIGSYQTTWFVSVSIYLFYLVAGMHNIDFTASKALEAQLIAPNQLIEMCLIYILSFLFLHHFESLLQICLTSRCKLLAGGAPLLKASMSVIVDPDGSRRG